jgi:hypothetical protein
MDMREVEPGRLWVNKRFEGALGEEGLLSFEGLYGARGTPATKERPGKPRTVVKVQVNEAGKKRALYVKRHEGDAGLRRWWGWLTGQKSPARVEWENIFRLVELGVPTMTAVALGEDRGTGRSLTVTKELVGGQPLDEFVREAGTDQRRQLAVKLGELVKRLHGAGLTHKDLYLCHVYAVKGTGKETVLHLIDLQRVGRRGTCLRRWRVKDVAQLAYSRPREVTRTDSMRFLLAYFGERRLGASEKDFVWDVMSKAGQIARHDRKLRGQS